MRVSPYQPCNGMREKSVNPRVRRASSRADRAKNIFLACCDRVGLALPSLSSDVVAATACTFYKRCAVHGGMHVSEAQRLRELEAANSNYKKPLAEAPL